MLLPVARLNLTSGLESFRSGLSGLLTDFQKNGGFWNAASRSENIANAVQLGVKGGLNLVAPIVNGIASSVPIMVRMMMVQQSGANTACQDTLNCCCITEHLHFLLQRPAACSRSGWKLVDAIAA
jgi:hypothetical protein